MTDWKAMGLRADFIPPQDEHGEIQDIDQWLERCAQRAMRYATRSGNIWYESHRGTETGFAMRELVAAGVWVEYPGWKEHSLGTIRARPRTTVVEGSK